MLEKCVENKVTHSITDLNPSDLMEGDVDVKIEFSSFNFKDGLAVTNTLPIIKKYPIHSEKIKNLSLEEINKIIEYKVADSIIESVNLIFDDKFKTQKQSKSEGKLYFKKNSNQKR